MVHLDYRTTKCPDGRDCQYVECSAGCARAAALGVDLRQGNVRSATHGDFGDNAIVALQIRDVMRGMKPHWSNLTAEQRLALEEIALKIARIVSGGADVAEHWIDIQGYAKLGEKGCKR